VSKEFSLDSDLRIRVLQEDDAEELFRVVDSNRAHLREWLPWLDECTSVSHQREFIRTTLLQNEQGRGFVCSIAHSGQMAGVVGYHPIKWSNRSVEVGYWLARDEMGKGIMTRCCRFLVGHAFSVLDLNRVAIPVAVENWRSRAIPERLGFRMEGTIQDAEWLYDRYVTHALYAGVKRDWNHEAGRFNPVPQEGNNP
jgi:ribosomal-protein-serine acetyltransferase